MGKTTCSSYKKDPTSPSSPGPGAQNTGKAKATEALTVLHKPQGRRRALCTGEQLLLSPGEGRHVRGLQESQGH